MKRVKTRYVTKLYQYQDFLGHDDLERAMELTLHTNANKGLCYVIEEDGKIECIVHRGRVFRESPWTYIVTDPDGRPVADTLPPKGWYAVTIDTVHNPPLNPPVAYYTGETGRFGPVWVSSLSLHGEMHTAVHGVIAWRPLPDPAPLPEGERPNP